MTVRKIVFENKFVEYFQFLFYTLGSLFGIYLIFISDYWIGSFLILSMYLTGFGENFLKIRLYEDVLTIRRPFSLFRKAKTFTNSAIIKVVYEKPKWGNTTSKMIIYTQESIPKGHSFMFLNSHREMQRFFTAIEGLGIEVM